MSNPGPRATLCVLTAASVVLCALGFRYGGICAATVYLFNGCPRGRHPRLSLGFMLHRQPRSQAS